MAASEFQFTLASRGSIIPKIVLSGPSGAGKTTTALLFAYGLIEGKSEEDWQNIVVLDTENRRALNTLGRAFKFEDNRVVKICRFFHAPIEAPYKPDRMIRAMHAAAAVPVPNPEKRVVVLDSGTDEWEGRGGCLDWHRQLGGRDVDWKTVSPAHDEFLDAMRHLPCPVIMTLLEAQKHDIEKYTNSAGAEKHQIRKLGLKPRQRECFERKFDIHLTIEHGTNNASVGAGKDVTGLFTTMLPRPLTCADGEAVAYWAKNGVPVGSEDWIITRAQELRTAPTLEKLVDLFALTNKQIAGMPLIPEFRDEITKAKDEAKARLGLTK